MGERWNKFSQGSETAVRYESLAERIKRLQNTSLKAETEVNCLPTRQTNQGQISKNSSSRRTKTSATEEASQVEQYGSCSWK